MKFHWGTGIALFYTVFVGSLVFQVIKSTQYDHSLVAKNYYEYDLKYQEHYDKLQNSIDLSEEVMVSYNMEQQYVRLQFPTEAQLVEGTATFFRPSDAKKDVQFDLALDAQQEQMIETHQLSTGLWTVQIDWSAGGKTYYKESTIVL